MAKPTKEEMEKSPALANLRAALLDTRVTLRDPRHPLSDYPPYHLEQVVESVVGENALNLVRGSNSETWARIMLKDSRKLTEFQTARIAGELADVAESRGLVSLSGCADSFRFAVGLMFGLSEMEELNIRKLLMIAAIEAIPPEGFAALDALLRVTASMEPHGWGDQARFIRDYLNDPTRETACRSVSLALNYSGGSCLEDGLSDLLEWGRSFASARDMAQFEEWRRAASKGRLPYGIGSFDELEEFGISAEEWNEHLFEDNEEANM